MKTLIQHYAARHDVRTSTALSHGHISHKIYSYAAELRQFMMLQLNPFKHCVTFRKLYTVFFLLMMENLYMICVTVWVLARAAQLEFTLISLTLPLSARYTIFCP